MHKHVESALKAAPLNEYEYLICIPLKRGRLRSANGSLIYLDFYVK